MSITFGACRPTASSRHEPGTGKGAREQRRFSTQDSELLGLKKDLLDGLF